MHEDSERFVGSDSVVDEKAEGGRFKFLHLGDSLAQVVKTATLGPAELIDEGKELGSLSAGTVADLTIFRVVEQQTVLTDSLGNSETGDRDIQPAHCIRAGKLISDMKIPPADA